MGEGVADGTGVFYRNHVVHFEGKKITIKFLFTTLKRENIILEKIAICEGRNSTHSTKEHKSAYATIFCCIAHGQVKMRTLEH